MPRFSVRAVPCGSNGCGGSCGTCASGERCSTSGTCEPEPCDLVDQTGCPSGQRCTWNGTAPVCVPNGSLARGQYCPSDTCVAGTGCIRIDGSQACRGFCDSDSDCGLGRCVYTFTGTPTQVCAEECDPISGRDACASGTSCYVFNTSTTREVTDCRPYGFKATGTRCTLATECASFNTCMTGKCMQVCSLVTSCPKGACQPVTGWSRFGVCPWHFRPIYNFLIYM